jgi:hypothetical protein
MDFQAVGFQIKAFNNPGSDLAGVMQHPARLISGMKFLSYCQTTDTGASFKDENLTAQFGQKGSGGQTVVTGTDYDYVVCVVCGCFHT